MVTEFHQEDEDEAISPYGYQILEENNETAAQSAQGAVQSLSAISRPDGTMVTADSDPTAVVAAQAAELASTGKLDAARWAGRTRKLYCQPNLTAPAVVRPYPHRIKGIPLLTKQGMLNDVYLQDCPSDVGLGLIDEEVLAGADIQ